MRTLRRTLISLAAGLALVTGLAACGSTDDDDGGEIVGSVERGPVTDVRQSDDGLKVVALGWSDGEIALALGVKPVAIYDWQGHGEDNHGVGPWASDEFGDAEVEVIKNTGTSYNYEQIELLDPDVILNVRAGVDEEVFERLSQIAPVASAPEGTGDFAVDWASQTEIIGQAIGKEQEAAEAIDATTTVLSQTAADHPEFAGLTFNFGTKFGDGYGAYLPGDARFDVFAELGFVASPATAALGEGGFFASVPIEKVASLEADAAILTTIGLPFTDLTGDRLINSLAMVQEGRALLLEETDEIIVALSAGTPESIALAVQEVAPLLAQAIAG